MGKEGSHAQEKLFCASPPALFLDCLSPSGIDFDGSDIDSVMAIVLDMMADFESSCHLPAEIIDDILTFFPDGLSAGYCGTIHRITMIDWKEERKDLFALIGDGQHALFAFLRPVEDATSDNEGDVCLLRGLVGAKELEEGISVILTAINVADEGDDVMDIELN